ncbi:hypothetical protein GCM10010187_32240 [Actinomadura coerulea]|nr:hypothetical protein GCM10010187_32240 [Actinomadura coerulea]
MSRHTERLLPPPAGGRVRHAPQRRGGQPILETTGQAPHGVSQLPMPRGRQRWAGCWFGPGRFETEQPQHLIRRTHSAPCPLHRLASPKKAHPACVPVIPEEWSAHTPGYTGPLIAMSQRRAVRHPSDLDRRRLPGAGPVA